MSRPRATSSESDQLAATIASLKSRLNDLESSTNYVGSQSNSGRNLIINGGMQVAQRGTSTASITTSGYYTADRWQTQLSSLGTWTQSVQADAPGSSGLRNSLKMLCTTADASPAAGDYALVAYNFEGQDLRLIGKGSTAAKPVTLSFWVKSNVTGTFIVVFYDNDNTRSISASYTVNVSGAWEYKTITIPIESLFPFDNDENLSMSIRFMLGAGTSFTSGTLNTSWNSYVAANSAVGQTNVGAANNNYWQITGVQFETGAVATQFDYSPYGPMLQRCLRYYYRYTSTSSVYGGTGFVVTTTTARLFFPFPVRMRIEPSALEQTGTASNYAIAYANTSVVCTAVPTWNLTATDSATIILTGTGLTVGQGVMAILSGANRYLGWSAEL